MSSLYRGSLSSFRQAFDIVGEERGYIHVAKGYSRKVTPYPRRFRRFGMKRISKCVDWYDLSLYPFRRPLGKEGNTLNVFLYHLEGQLN